MSEPVCHGTGARLRRAIANAVYNFELELGKKKEEKAGDLFRFYSARTI